MTAHVSLKNVTKVFRRPGGAGDVPAVGPLDLELRQGEFFAIVGPSGCGKSTLLELIAGLTGPTSGDVAFEGRTIADRVPDGIGVVFQLFALAAMLMLAAPAAAQPEAIALLRLSALQGRRAGQDAREHGIGCHASISDCGQRSARLAH